MDSLQTMKESAPTAANTDPAVLAENPAKSQRRQVMLNSGILQNAILNSANVTIIATDEKGIIELFNVGAERMLGYRAIDIVNKTNPGDLLDLDELMALTDALNLEFGTLINPGFETLAFKASRGIEDSYELTYICKDGSRLPAVISITALTDQEGVRIGYLLIGTNDCLRKRVEAELTSAKVAAEKASIAKSEFLVRMSHEVRTPLNVILGFAQLMESSVPPSPPSQTQNLKQILIAGRYLLDLSNGILDLALVESGEAALTHEPVSLAEVMLECRAMIEPRALKRRIGITFPRFEAPCFVKADRTRVKQVLINLLVNAIKYNNPGGAVAVQHTNTHANTNTVGGTSKSSPPTSIRINVRDTGPGMPPELLAQLFQPFNRLGRETGEEPGSGIGLVVSRQLVELMGGTIGVDSVVGEGSVFWIELQTAAAPEALPVTQQIAPVSVTPLVTVGAAVRTLLYVEDNLANLKLVQQIIARRPDLRLLYAPNATLGIESAGINQPALILMDINMPGLNGMDAMKILRRHPSTAHIPIIALSANAMPQDIEKGMEAGFFNYVTKPIHVGRFIEAVDAALHFSQITAGEAGAVQP